jgi:hypothetical protein
MSEAEIWRLVRLAMPSPLLTEAEEAAVVLPPSLRDPAAILRTRMPPTCQLCGEPMPPGEEVFQYHGFSGPCPKPTKEATPVNPEVPEMFVPSPDRMLKWFEYAHLPEKLQAISKPFGDLAHRLATDVPSGPERTVALRKLLEAKDAAVRAALNPGC